LSCAECKLGRILSSLVWVWVKGSVWQGLCLTWGECFWRPATSFYCDWRFVAGQKYLLTDCEMFLSSTLPLSPPSSSLLRRQIVNPHCGASYGRAPGPYFRGQIHHVWCGWCSHNSSLTAVMFSGIIQRSINTRAWRKYNAFIKTVNRKYFQQKPEEKRITGFPEVCVIILLMPSDDDKTNANRNNSRKLMYWNRLKYHILFLFLMLDLFSAHFWCKYIYIFQIIIIIGILVSYVSFYCYDVSQVLKCSNVTRFLKIYNLYSTLCFRFESRCLLS